MIKQVGNYRYQRLARQIEEEIAVSFGPGERFWSEVEIATRFDCNRRTVHKAVDVLIERGILERKTERTLAVPTAFSNGFNSSLVVVIMPVGSDLWHELFLELSQLALEHGKLLLLLDVTGTEGKFHKESVYGAQIQQLKKALKLRPGTLIHFNASQHRFLAEHIEKEQLSYRNLILLSESSHEPVSPQKQVGIVCTDRDKVLPLMAADAKRAGYRHFCVSCPVDYLLTQHLVTRQAVSLEVGRDEEDIPVFLEDADGIRDLVTFCSDHRPVAVLASYDYGAHMINGAIQSSGLRVPDDVGIYGQNNTKWAEKDGLSSVGYDTELWAREVYECIDRLACDDSFVKMQIPPILFRRGSSK